LSNEIICEWIERLFTLSGGSEGPGGGTPVTVVVTVVVVNDGTVRMLVNVLGGFSPPGESGTLLSLCWEPANRPTKIEQSRRKIRRRMSNILLRGVSGS
jgi:hypothetical protein